MIANVSMAFRPPLWERDHPNSYQTEVCHVRATKNGPVSAGAVRIECCPDLASLQARGPVYGRYSGTVLRPGFADQRFRHIWSASQNAAFLQAKAFRIR
jgi:hypothetical protein